MHKNYSALSLIKAIAVVYFILGSGSIIYVVLELGAENIWFLMGGLIIPLIMVVSSIGTYLNKKWGRAISYPISVFLLAGVPLGTILGGFMLIKLWQTRNIER